MQPIQPEKPKKRGRPSGFDTVNKKQMEVLYKNGFTDVKVCEFFEINEATLTNWKKKNPDFLVSLKDWKEGADGNVERSLYERATGYRTTFKKNFVVSDGPTVGSHVEVHEEEIVFAPDPTSCIFWLKNRKPEQWRDKREIDHNVSLSLAERIKSARQRVQTLIQAPN